MPGALRETRSHESHAHVLSSTAAASSRTLACDSPSLLTSWVVLLPSYTTQRQQRGLSTIGCSLHNRVMLSATTMHHKTLSASTHTAPACI
jgi:hypothetical protein